VKFVSVPCLLSACFLSPGRCRDVCNWRTAAVDRTSALGRKQKFKHETLPQAPAKAIAAAPERPASGNQCERIRKLISRWHRDELGAERKAARRKCSKALAPILDIIGKYAVQLR
jgi:hypothetical protein